MKNESGETVDDASTFIGLFETRHETSAARRKDRTDRERKASGLPAKKPRSAYRCFPTSFRVSQEFKDQLALVMQQMGADASLCDALHFVVEQAASRLKQTEGDA
jgi:hypothetical protein